MLLRFLTYLALIFLYCFLTATSVAVGVLTALRMFKKIDLNNGMNLIVDISTGIALEKEQAESKKKIKKEKKNEVR